MLRRIKAAWKRLERLEPGERFVTFYSEQRHRAPAVKVVFFGLAFAAFAAGVLLAFIPGPAFLFFLLSGALLATQSLWVARRLDQGEVWGRRRLASLGDWLRRRRSSRH